MHRLLIRLAPAKSAAETATGGRRGGVLGANMGKFARLLIVAAGSCKSQLSVPFVPFHQPAARTATGVAFPSLLLLMATVMMMMMMMMAADDSDH